MQPDPAKARRIPTLLYCLLDCRPMGFRFFVRRSISYFPRPLKSKRGVDAKSKVKQSKLPERWL